MKTKVGLASLTLLACTAMLGGCATLTDGTTQELSFQTNPDQVMVTLIRQVPDEADWTQKDKYRQPKPPTMHEETRILGKTPLTLHLDRAEGQTVVFSKDGYKPLTMKLATGTNPNFWGNAAIGGPFGSTTDSASGAIYEYVPSQYFVTLIPVIGSSVENATLQSQRDKALAFLVRRYAGIMTNLAQGIGEDWNALKGLLNIGQGQEADARQKIRALAMVYPDIAVFATHVTDLYVK